MVNKKRKTHEQFLKEFNEVHNGNVNIIGIYIGVKDKIEVECLDCAHEWKVTPSNLLSGSGCPKCAANKIAKSREKTHDQFVNEIFDIVGNEYTLLSEYVYCLEKVTFKHNICDYIYKSTPANFLQGHRCPKCAKRQRRTHEEYESEVYDLVGNEYALVGKFVDVRTKIEMYHRACDKNFCVAPSNFLKGQRCPHCALENRRGENNHFWKGGKSPIVNILRGFVSTWKLDSLKEYNFLCALSGINDGTLEVHHLSKNFSEIANETFELQNLPIYENMSNYTQAEINSIKDKILELHYFYGLGVPLTRDLHQKFHITYGRTNNTPEQFEEFKTNYTKSKEVVNNEKVESSL